MELSIQRTEGKLHHTRAGFASVVDVYLHQSKIYCVDSLMNVIVGFHILFRRFSTLILTLTLALRLALLFALLSVHFRLR